MREPRVLNVAEKPSVARSLAAVFARMQGAQDGGMRREAHQIFTAQSVPFPALHTQGHYQRSNGPGACCLCCVLLLNLFGFASFYFGAVHQFEVYFSWFLFLFTLHIFVSHFLHYLSRL